MQFIQDKITAPAQLPRVGRERLRQRLAASLDACTSTVIIGRTGAGKTMLATDFAWNCGRAVSWYKVDAGDSDFSVFLRYMIASVRARVPQFGEGMLARLEHSDAVKDARALAESFVYDLVESGTSLLLVIDDLHLVYDELWLAPFFGRLLPLLPPEAHMLIIGRSMPSAPLWRMRSKQTLCVVEEAELDFTSEEALELFRSYGLTSDGSAHAYDETHGRAVALDVFAQASCRQEHPTPLGARLSGDSSATHISCSPKRGASLTPA